MDPTGRMLDAVARANRRLAALGLGLSHAIVYTAHRARLLDVQGKEWAGEEGPAELACALLAARVEWGLRGLLARE